MWVRAIVATVLFLLPTALYAQAEKRVALVIGNSAYQHAPTLDNPANDAADMSAALKKHGFKVIDGFDLDKSGFDRKVRDFSVMLRGAEVGLFFYAGHGLQVAGQNYLVPIDAKAEAADALDWEMVRLDLVHRTMERVTTTNIIFLDACRNNPLARNLARAMGTRSAEIGRGLAAVESGVGTLISFSTQPGNVALDGTGRNSPFASALVRQLSNPTDDLSAILIAVRNDVMKETQRKQVPWEHSALTGRFYFRSAQPGAAPASNIAAAPSSEAAEAWSAVKDVTSIPTLEAYLSRFKDTFFAELARQRIEELRQQRSAVAAISPDRTGLSPTVPPPRPMQEEKRVALLIGNQGYSSDIGPLANPHNDIALLEKALIGLGFGVTTVRDASLHKLHQAINNHARRVQKAGPNAVGFFYYSGHGAAEGGLNYLLPVDVKTTDTGEVWDHSLRLTEITRKLATEARNATHFVVFDASSNTLKLTRAGSRAVVQPEGFVPTAPENGMLIAYATAEGELASDVGVGARAYAKALAEELVKPGVEAVVMFRNVQRRVRGTTGQEPYLAFRVMPDVYLAGEATTVRR